MPARSVEHTGAAVNRRATQPRRMNAAVDGSPIYRALFLSQKIMRQGRRQFSSGFNRLTAP
jgi:hypothetical protein